MSSVKVTKMCGLNSPIVGSVISVLIVTLLLTSKCRGSPREQRFWPLNNTHHQVDLPQSSSFGPRGKISEGSRYDYHRGVDIPAAIGTEAYAIDDGKVRIGGRRHDLFSDGVIQLEHTGWDDDGDTSKKYYSTYIHMKESLLEGMEGMEVTRGQLIGQTGDLSVSSFPHLHFEIRAGGLRQDSNCNPWKYLPCEHCSSFLVNLTVIPNEGDEECTTLVQVSVPPNQLTFNRVRLVATGGETDYDKDFDLCVDNKFYTNTPSYNATRLDNSTLIEYLTISPHFFNSKSYGKNEWSATNYTFKLLPKVQPGSVGMVTAYVYDVFENEVISTPIVYTCPATDPESNTTEALPTDPESSTTEAILTTRLSTVTPPPIASSTRTSMESFGSAGQTVHSTRILYCSIFTGYALLLSLF